MRRRNSVKQELPLIIWLMIVWGALWSDFSPGNLIFGALIALGITQLLYLPPVELGGRFNIIHGISVALNFLYQVVLASIEVSYLAVVKGPRLENSVVAVQLRSASDLIVTATGHFVSLVPGSLVVEVDRSTSTLYLHGMNIVTEADADRMRANVRDIEARLIRAMGSKSDLELVRSDSAHHSDPARRGNAGGKEDAS
ncbi:Na+/H+ antiporter subunit E [Arthrobacter pigmenti]